jgi:hypothetical protein
MRDMSKFYRTDEVSRTTTGCPLWLERFAEQMAVQDAKTAVEVARDRSRTPSVFEQMSSIVSGAAPRAGSVEDVVKEYQKRTGLDSYIKSSSLQSAAQSIIANAEAEEKKV